MSRVARIGRAGARAVTAVAGWTGDRIGDLAHWAVNLIRDLPVRVGRLALTLWAGVLGLVLLVPGAVRAWRAGRWHGLRGWARNGILYTGAWLGTLLTRVLDLPGIPELAEFVWRAGAHVSPLTGTEIAAASEVLGPAALRYGDIRVAQGGLLRLIHAWNGQRAFVTFHTVNLPRTGPHARANLDVLIHELVHVYQYERLGSVYGGESLVAQRTAGYDYGGLEGLRQALAAGRSFGAYNREQQAQIVQDYFARLRSGSDTADYEPFIADLRAGRFKV